MERITPAKISVLMGRDGHKYDLSRVSDEFLCLVHDLSTHQFELQAQNEELQNIQEALEESRDRYSDLYDHAPIGYATICRKGLIHEANLTLATMLGTTKTDLIGSAFSRYITYADQDVWYLNHKQLFDKGFDLSCELKIRTEKGEFWAMVSGKYQKTSSESGPFVRCVISDISQRKKDEQDRFQLEKRIRQSQKLESLELIVGGIAHDYNNLLMGVMGNLELTRMKLLPEHEVVPYLKNAQSATSLLAELTNQMLAYAGRGNSIIETLDLSQVLQNMSDLLRSIVSKSITIQYDARCAAGLVDIDPSQLHQILINLALNASEAMANGGALWIRTGVMQADANYLRRCFLGDKRVPGDHVYLEFEDQGSGISPGDLDKIFDPFFSTKQDGRGMGLAAVLGIVQKHKGAIHVSSLQGRGSLFRLLFPVSLKQKAVPVGGRTANQVQPGHGTILVVDDECIVRDTAQEMLTLSGYSVVTAQNGFQAVETALKRNQSLAAILLDLSMPGIDGAETARRIRHHFINAPIIIMSGYAEHEVRNTFGSVSINGFIQKPFNVASLVDTLHSSL